MLQVQPSFSFLSSCIAILLLRTGLGAALEQALAKVQTATIDFRHFLKLNLFLTFLIFLNYFSHKNNICLHTTYILQLMSDIFWKLNWFSTFKLSFYQTGQFFHRYPLISVPKRKSAKQPITASLGIRIYRKSSSDWLAGSFLFGTEMGGYQ